MATSGNRRLNRRVSSWNLLVRESVKGSHQQSGTVALASSCRRISMADNLEKNPSVNVDLVRFPSSEGGSLSSW
ncbi:hypothetical protein CC2G_005269 [Coprinopsis cinerea AmutBmut pab1-1]|nr:hypothetical protein CC2G_005269 [Coprinopsis cinerea AmutBmut pab1-1]